MKSLKYYIGIARPDHWVKNIFMIPGVALALIVGNDIPVYLAAKTVFGLAILCLLSSANYTINEYLDAASDKFHPSKKNRAGARGHLKAHWVALEYAALTVAGLSCAEFFGRMFFLAALAFIAVSLIYNVAPFRMKDRAYLDVIFESMNSPLRLLMGWYIVAVYPFPPSSALLAYWAGGAFLMAMKRYSEYRYIGNAERAASYRRSFKSYTEDTLLLSSFFYALNSTFFLGVFLVKYRIEYVLTLPFIAFMFVWYMAIALRRDSAAQAPEKLRREGPFLFYVGFLWLLLTAMAFIDVPFLHPLTAPTHY